MRKTKGQTKNGRKKKKLQPLATARQVNAMQLSEWCLLGSRRGGRERGCEGERGRRRRGRGYAIQC
jgi:hypothetical protein